MVSACGVGSAASDISTAVSLASALAVGSSAASRSNESAADRSEALCPVAMDLSRLWPVAFKSAGVG